MRLEVDPCDRGGWDRIGCSRERGLGTVIEDVEAADTEVKVVVGEEFGEIQGLVLHCDVRLELCWSGFCNKLIGAHLPYRLPCTLHHPEAEAEGTALVRKCLLRET